MQIFHIFPKKPPLLPIYFTTCSSRHIQESVYRPNGLENCTQLLFVIEGEGLLRCEGQDYPLKAGSAFYLDCNVPHKYTNLDNLTTAWITYDGTGYDNIRNYIDNKTFLYCKETAVKRYVAQIKEIEREYYDKKITIRQLAEINHSSKSTFCKEFKDTFGCTPLEKLTNIRMLNAKYFLQLYPSEKINVIAKKCGFEDAGYFCKAYKARYGITPKDERKKRIVA